MKRNIGNNQFLFTKLYEEKSLSLFFVFCFLFFCFFVFVLILTIGVYHVLL
jgi:hypothetical protein